MTTRTRAALKNLRAGVRKMEQTMTPAALVRRNFRLGRPAKEREALPLHRSVVWKRATEALARFKLRMSEAGLNPLHAEAKIVYVRGASPEEIRPRFLGVEIEGPSVELLRSKAYEMLADDDVIAPGMVFRQFDALASTEAYFPYQFTGLSTEGIEILRDAATLMMELMKPGDELIGSTTEDERPP